MNTILIAFILLFPICYIIGSVNSSIILSRIYKLPDPRDYGSKNPGATNILRSGNKILSLLILLLDILKGFLPVLIAYYIIEDKLYVQVAGVIAVLGHIYPIFYKFKGGKGVATAFGAILGFDIILGLICMITWLITAFLFRYSALSAIVSFTFLPIYTWLSYEILLITLVYLILTVVVIYKHKTNIHNLLNNKETKIGNKN
ncbi:MAG: glycerol-3-phosphate 1-O-acyltransferase PlsY [Gammaproteobacteria bacterium]|nr:glycerol-3-phosphate 1-O-acyltransferase PlsY [Gammaproteobacteria bacterium]MBT7603860.1 glycerol-3-phosphate 1-O-acyltransferase PlsY [Gammaproteobacteria bacterium]